VAVPCQRKSDEQGDWLARSSWQSCHLMGAGATATELVVLLVVLVAQGSRGLDAAVRLWGWWWQQAPPAAPSSFLD